MLFDNGTMNREIGGWREERWEIEGGAVASPAPHRAWPLNTLLEHREMVREGTNKRESDVQRKKKNL